MNQDFHYYGTYYAARLGGFDRGAATRIAAGANFIDFLSNTAYAGSWNLVTDREPSRRYDEVANIDNPRFTFQGLLSTGVSPEDGLWCSYHFLPGNYHYDELPAEPDRTAPAVDNPSSEVVHGLAVATELPPFTARTVRAEIGIERARMLNRPQSALSRMLMADTLACADLSTGRLVEVLGHAVAGPQLAADAATVERFRQLLIGIRAHVIADTWAHQDWSGVSDTTNTYWDVNDRFGREAIDYDDGTTDGFITAVLSSTNLRNANLQSAPAIATIGHGWMGHFPDYSFVSYRYRPRWRDEGAEPLVRNNPTEYRSAFLEMCSLFTQAAGNGYFNPESFRAELAVAQSAIESPCTLADRRSIPRVSSSTAWLDGFAGDAPEVMIDAEQEPDPAAVLDGVVDAPGLPLSLTRYGTFRITVDSDLALFQIAADYHFHVVRSWLERHGVRRYRDSWSLRDGPFARAAIDDLIAERVRAA